MKSSFRFTCLFVFAIGASFHVQADLLSASSAFLHSLSPDQKATTIMPFDSEERTNWHFIPKDRMGLSFKTLSDQQDKLLLDILSAGLSLEGYEKVETIRSLEVILREMEGAEHRDLERYHILFFGEPTPDGNWTVRYEGHHVSLHWTFVAGKLVSGSPQFLGSNPAEVRIENPKKGLRILAAVEDLARALAVSLSDEQKAMAIIGMKVPNDIFTANQQKVEPLEDLGIRYDQLSADQQSQLRALIDVVARVQSKEITEQRLNKVNKAGLDGVKFAWLGSLEPGQRHYYRIQGSTFLIEYDNTQNNVNHIHVVWRDFDGDFGRDILSEHHAQFDNHDHPGEHNH